MYPSRKMILIKAMFWISKEKINEWIQEKELFFILSMGRSGTKFLSYLLNKSPNAYVVHETVRSDFRAYRDALSSEKMALKYIKNFRKKEIYLRVRNKDVKIYGEVNGILRRHCKALKNIFPEAKFIHLVRDGRDVVRSAMSRKAITITKNIHPSKKNQWYNKWNEMNRFEKSCWFWDIENRYLIKKIENLVRFEEIISDYEYFKNNLLKILNLNIPEEIWKNNINVPRNITNEFQMPHWTKWTAKQTESFNQICGETMRRIGYSI